MKLPNLRYAKGMPITIAHIGQPGQFGGKIRSFWMEWTKK